MRIHLKVVPGSSRDGISGWLGDSLKVRVRAPAEGGRANAAVIKVLARGLDVAPQTLEMVSGAASARKVIEVDTLSEDEVRQRLACTNI
jgi:uncharacterized protein (TIGR00251 family)